ncbi:MAG: hypothetical protein M3276_00850 [Actinomycetota bacterium]|nr:hypothetical protein [Actinomycetota bacterium]
MDTFLVQVWVPADDTSRDGDLRGVVRHVATGVETPFRGDDEILAVLRQATGYWRPEPDEKENEQ